MNFNTLSFEKIKKTGVITINRPGSLNAINSEMTREMSGVLDIIEKDDEILAVVVTGGNKLFMAGADIKELLSNETPVAIHSFLKRLQALFNRFAQIEKPVIAAINGPAFGGGAELALACDIRIASEKASFALPEIKLGVMPGAGGTQRLPRLVGTGKALELLLLGDPVDAIAALNIGLVNRVVPNDVVFDEALKMAEQLSARAGHAVKMIKSAVYSGEKMDLLSALEYEGRCFELLFSTEDQAEGMRAFLEKRLPEFRNY